MSTLSTGIAAFLAIQADAQLAAQLERIAGAQLAIAIALGLVALILIGIGLMALRALGAVNRVLRRVEQQAGELAPRVQPLLDRVTRVATDASDISDTVRKRVNEVMDTVDDLNRSLKKAGAAAEGRVREFAAVVDVVQEEAEQLMLDTAATARGLHTTAEQLRDVGLLPAREREQSAADD